MERVPGGYIGAIPAQNAASRPGVASMEQTLEAMEREGTVPFPGNDPLADYVTLLLDVEDVNGKIIDESGRNHTVQVWNNCIVTENDRRIGTSSMFFNGNSSFIEIPSSYDLHVGSSDFTLECWFKILTQKEQAIVSKEQVSTGTSGILLYIQPNLTLRFLAGNGSSWFVDMTTSFTPLPGVWYHVAVSRNERTWAMFVDGTIVGFAISSSGVWYGQTSRPLQIGRYGPWNDATKDFHGYIDKVRLTERAVRYSPNFSVATAQLPTNTSGDPYFNNVSMLLLMNGSNGSTTFTDSSNNNLTVTPNGNAQISTTQSKFGGASAYLDGSGDYLSIAANAGFVFNGDFTIECWAYFLSVSTNKGIFASAGERFGLIRTASTLYWLGSTDINGSGATLVANRWYHVAASRSGGILRLFVDGTLVGSGPSTQTPASNTWFVGSNQSNEHFDGYIDDLRVTKGVARYPTPFTPPSRPVGFNRIKTGDPYFMDVGLLLRAEGSDGSRIFTDSSRRNLAITPVGGLNTITANGNAQISTAQSKFGGSSAYFDGTGDYLTISATSALTFGVDDFTIELWLYPIAYGNSVCGATLFGTTNGSSSGWSFNLGENRSRLRLISNLSGTWTDNLSVSTNGGPDLNTWSHLALVRSGTNLTIYVNGVSAATMSTASGFNFGDGPFFIGRFNDGTNLRELNGYIDDLRITKGIARYKNNFIPPTIANPTNASNDIFYSNVRLLMSMNGTNGSTVFTDSSITGSAVSTITSKVGSASAFFKGDGYLSVPDSDAFNFAASDFTVEAWIRLTNYAPSNGGVFSSAIATSDVSGSRGWTFMILGTATSYDRVEFAGYNPSFNVVTVPYNFSLNTWYHVAAVRAQNRVFIFVNGKLQNKDGTAFNITIQDSSSVLKVGANDFDGTYKYYFNGFIDELRITKNVARYISDFTPSTSPLPDSYKATGADPYGKYTTFLLRAEGPNGYTLIRDSSYVDNPITVNGNAAISTADKKFGNSSLYFDGTGDYLSVPNDVFRFEKEDFTIEFWVKLETNTTTYPYIISSSPWNSGSGFYVTVQGPATGWGGAARIYFNASTGSNGGNVGSTTVVRDNQWHHVAITKAGSLHTMWVDGIAEGASNASSANYLGTGGLIFSDLLAPSTGGDKGYLDEMRVTRGLARYSATITVPTTEFTSDANTSLLLLMNGTNNSTTFTDSSSNALTVTPSGDAKIVTSLSAFGGSSAFLDGTGDFLSVPNSSLFNFGTGDFTIEAWIYPIGNMGRLITNRATQTAASGTWSFGVESLASTTALSFVEVIGGEPGVSSGTMPFSIRNQWNHVVVERASGVTKFFLNGIMVGAGLQSTNFNNISYPVYIGTSPNESVSHGYIDLVRISKGIARYTQSTFTPPTTAFPDP